MEITEVRAYLKVRPATSEAKAEIGADAPDDVYIDFHGMLARIVVLGPDGQRQLKPGDEMPPWDQLTVVDTGSLDRISPDIYESLMVFKVDETQAA